MCLKRVFFGDPCLFRKGAWYSFGVLKDMENFTFLDRGKSV